MLPGSRDVGGVHEPVHDESGRVNVPPRRPETARAGHEPSGPTSDCRHHGRLAENATRDARRSLGERAVAKSTGERREELVADVLIARVLIVEHRHIAVTDEGSPSRPIASDIAKLQPSKRKPSTCPGLHPRPHVVVAEAPVARVPAPFMANVGSGLKRKHAIAEVTVPGDHVGHLIEVVGRDRHVVGHV